MKFVIVIDDDWDEYTVYDRINSESRALDAIEKEKKKGRHIFDVIYDATDKDAAEREAARKD
jgi:hypothetical protein